MVASSRSRSVLTSGGEPRQLVDGVVQRCPAAAEKISQRGGSVVERVDRGADGVAVLGQSLDQLIQPVDRAGELLTVLGQGVEHRAQIVDQLLDDLVAVGQ